MNKIVLFIAIMAIVAIDVFAQGKTDANVTGHVINESTGAHIPFINVSIKGTTIGTTTDATGHYFLKNLPEGFKTIVVSGIGYKSTEKEVIMVSGTTLEVNFEIEEDHILLEGVVISASRNETNRKEAPTIVNIISPKLFENTNSVCLAQGLNYKPGLRVESNCQNCGFMQVRINGLEGAYTQILIDSRPIFSSLAGVYGIEQIPVNMVERVEIVRGGGSASFGSNAIAGTINIITKEPTSNFVSLSNTTHLIYGKKADINLGINASILSDDNKTGVVIFASSRQRSPFDYDNDGFTEIGKIESKNIGLNGYYKLSNYSKLNIEYHNLGEFRRGGSTLHLPPHQSQIAEQTEHNINAGSIKYDLLSKNSKHKFSIYTSAQKINRKSYYGAQQDLNAYGLTTDETVMAGSQYNYNIEKLIFMPSQLTIGSEYIYNGLVDNMCGYNRKTSQYIRSTGLFVQNEWQSKSINLLIGGRVDKNSIIDAPIISPRISVRYTPENFVILRGGYAEGFRSPQTFDEDLHLTAVAGSIAVINNDDMLKTEKSKTYNVSTDFYKNFNNIQTNLLIEGFYTQLNNVFVLEQEGILSNGNLLIVRRNGAGAVVKGLNLEANIIPLKNIQLQMGFTLQSSLYNEAETWSENPNIKPQRKMFRTPDRYGFIMANYSLRKSFNFSLTGTYTGPMLVQHFEGYIPEDAEKITPDFYDINLKISYNIPINSQKHLQFNAGMQNILNSYQNDFDKGVFRDAGYIYGPSLPRTYSLGIKFSM